MHSPNSHPRDSWPLSARSHIVARPRQGKARGIGVSAEQGTGIQTLGPCERPLKLSQQVCKRRFQHFPLKCIMGKEVRSLGTLCRQQISGLANKRQESEVVGGSEYRGALAPFRSGVTRGATRLAAGRGAHASPDPFLAISGHVGSTLGAGARGSDAGTRPLRSSVGDGAADLKPLSGGHESREVHTRWSGRARNPGLGLGSELTSCRSPRPLGLSFPSSGRHRPSAQPSLQWTHPGAAIDGAGQQRRQSRHCGRVWIPGDFRR